MPAATIALSQVPKCLLAAHRNVLSLRPRARSSPPWINRLRMASIRRRFDHSRVAAAWCRLAAMSPLRAVDDLVENLQLLSVVLLQVVSHTRVGRKRTYEDHQLQQVRRVLAVEARIEVLLLLGLP